MTNEQLDYAVQLSQKIELLEIIIKDGKTQTCEWIEFTFGNGTNRKNVCNDENIIKSIRDIIVQENEQKLAKLKQEFKTL